MATGHVSPRIALVGYGNIAPKHLEVLRELGAEVVLQQVVGERHLPLTGDETHHRVQVVVIGVELSVALGGAVGRELVEDLPDPDGAVERPRGAGREHETTEEEVEGVHAVLSSYTGRGKDGEGRKRSPSGKGATSPLAPRFARRAVSHSSKPDG